MTLHAPLHLQRCHLIHQRHVVHLPVAGGAADAFVDVYAVVEIGEVRQVVNPHPLDWLVVAQRCAHRFKIRTVSPDLRVAVHTGLRRRQSGRSRGLHTRMTVAAIYAVVADVMLMTELYGLRASNVGLRVVVRAIEFQKNPQQRRSYKDSTEDAHPRNGISALMKYLGHGALQTPSQGFSSEGNLSLTLSRPLRPDSKQTQDYPSTLL